jgi:tRNA(fMet)-specific endonuclease VapC
MMIAAHAVAAGAVLVTRDKAFSRVPDPLKAENWDTSDS